MRGDALTDAGRIPAAAPSPSERSAGEQERLASALAQIDAALGNLTQVDIEEIAVHACEAAFGDIEKATRRMKALQTVIYRSIERRRVEFVEHSVPGDPRAGQKAKRKLSEDLQRRTRQTPTEVGQIGRTAEQLDTASSPTRDAFVRGDITSRHMQLLGDTLRGADEDAAASLEAELLEIATRVNTREFAKECQRRLAEIDYPRAVDDQQARHARRSLRVAMGDDGFLHISGQLTGIDAETAATAIQHFRQPDPAGTPPDAFRTAEQATADAFVQLCDLALRNADSTEHGHRPQVIVTIDYQTLLSEAGIAEGSHIGPLPFDEMRRLLSDAGVARILTDPRRLPIEAGESKRSVPNGLWRALIVRDGGCVADGCSAPPGWCDVAHLSVPFKLEGRLSIDNAAMACRRHHRNFDLDGWKSTWVDGRPVIHHPGRPPTPQPPRPPRSPGAGTETARTRQPVERSSGQRSSGPESTAPPGRPAGAGPSPNRGSPKRSNRTRSSKRSRPRSDVADESDERKADSPSLF